MFFVTGASRGLGRGIVEALLARGTRVVGCARSAADIHHENYTHLLADVADDTSVRDAFKAAQRLAPLHAVIHNAGMSQEKLAVFTSAHEADAIIRTNLTGAFLVNREAIKVMKRQKFGRIINFSSINVRLGSAGSALYNASKGGVSAMTLSLSRECAADDITINCLGLSLVEHSGMADSLAASAAAEKTRSLIKPAPLKLEEIVHAIDFLCSPLAKNITGQTIYFGGVN